MLRDLKAKLPGAEGRSEFVITVFCDIRGFSAFSSMQESTNTAIFIKKVYLKLINEYFHTAVFAKPTGDGLLLVFRYNETTLRQTSTTVLMSCFKAINDFPKFFTNDPMVNFKTPEHLAFGVARGAACCLYSKSKIIDYSGRLLNLAARLNDLARPSGITIDGSFQLNVIPKDLRCDFSENHVYIRSISEESTHLIYCSSHVKVPTFALSPYTSTEWAKTSRKLSVKDLHAMANVASITISNCILSKDKTKLQMNFANKKIDGCIRSITLDEYRYESDANGTHILITLDAAKEYIKKEKLSDDDNVTFEFQYIPKPASPINISKAALRKKKPAS